MTTSRMPEADEPQPGAPRPGRRRLDRAGANRPGRTRGAAALACAAALALLPTACASPGEATAPSSSAGQPASGPPSEAGPGAAPGAGDAASLAEVPETQPPGTSIVSGTSENGGAARLTVVVDAPHAWITAKADLAGTALEGTCEFVLERGAQGGDRVGSQTARILSTREGTRCSGVSFPVGETDEYRVTVTVPDAAGRPLAVSTVVEYAAALSG